MVLHDVQHELGQLGNEARRASFGRVRPGRIWSAGSSGHALEEVSHRKRELGGVEDQDAVNGIVRQVQELQRQARRELGGSVREVGFLLRSHLYTGSLRALSGAL